MGKTKKNWIFKVENQFDLHYLINSIYEVFSSLIPKIGPYFCQLILKSNPKNYLTESVFSPKILGSKSKVILSPLPCLEGRNPWVGFPTFFCLGSWRVKWCQNWSPISYRDHTSVCFWPLLGPPTHHMSCLWHQITNLFSPIHEYSFLTTFGVIIIFMMLCMPKLYIGVWQFFSIFPLVPPWKLW